MSTQEPDYEDLGEISITAADDANIPVDIWLAPGEDGDDGFWVLRADNYMPRKGRLSGEGSYRARSRDREALARLVREHWLPLYQAAVRVLSGLPQEADGSACLYYWREPVIPSTD